MDILSYQYTDCNNPVWIKYQEVHRVNIQAARNVDQQCAVTCFWSRFHQAYRHKLSISPNLHKIYPLKSCDARATTPTRFRGPRKHNRSASNNSTHPTYNIFQARPKLISNAKVRARSDCKGFAFPSRYRPSTGADLGIANWFPLTR